MSELKNKRHEAFCHEYVKELNATKAYKAVYTTVNDDTARANSAKLLTNTNIVCRVKELTDARNQRTDSDADAFIEQLKYMSMFDPTEVLNWDGFMLNVKNFDEIPVEARRMITSVKERKEFTEDGTYIGASLDIKFASKEKVMEMFGRHLGTFNDKLQISNKTIEDIVREAKGKK